MRIDVDNFNKRKSFFGTSIREKGDFVYDMMEFGDTLGDLSDRSTFDMWQGLVVQKFAGHAKLKWGQKNQTKFKDFNSFFDWFKETFALWECYGHWKAMIKDWLPTKGVLWKDLLITFKRYVQQYSLFQTFSKSDEQTYHFIKQEEFGNMIYHAVLASQMSEERKKDLKKRVMKNKKAITMMTIKEFEAEILQQLIIEEAKEAKLQRTNPRKNYKPKKNDQMKLGKEINAMQYSNYDKRNYDNSPRYGKGSYGKGKYGGNKSNDKSSYKYGRDRGGKGNNKSKNYTNYDQTTRKGPWKPFKVCTVPSYKQYRAGQTKRGTVQAWIRNWDLSAIVYNDKCGKCQWYGHHRDICDLVKETPHLRYDLRQVSKKIWLSKRKKKKPGRGKGGKRRHANSIQSTTDKNDKNKNKDTKSTPKNTGKNAQAKRNKHHKHANMALSQTNQESINAQKDPDEQANIIQSDSNINLITNDSNSNNNNSNNQSNSSGDSRYQSFSNIRTTDTSSSMRYGVSSRYSA